MHEEFGKELRSAVQNGDSEKVQELLSPLAEEERVAAINTTPWGYTLLIEAACNGHDAVVEAILESITNEDSRIDVLNSKAGSETALMNAAYHGHVAVVRAILKYTPAHRYIDVISVHDRQKNTALVLAAMSGHAEVVRTILESITNEDSRIDVLNRKNDNMHTALILAAYHGHDAVVEAILESITDENSRIEVLNTKDGSNKTALMYAARDGHVKVVTAILDSIPKHRLGDVLNVKNNFGRTALDIDKSRGNTSVLKALKYADAFCRNLSIYQARKEGLDTIDYAQQLLDNGKLSLWDRLYLFLTGHFKLAFAFSNPKVTNKAERGSQGVSTGGGGVAYDLDHSHTTPSLDTTRSRVHQ